VQSVEELLKDANINYQAVRAVGFSGYNIYHKRSEQNQYHTHQIGNCYKLASSIKIDVIEDFRAADIAAGGTGAPLAPIYHKLLLENGKDAIYPACVLNIGGVSNITYIESKDSKPEELVAFDSSVGNCLMDDFALKAFNKTYDKDGYIAASGKINYALIDKIISEDKYFKQSYPKAIDRNHFNYVINKIKEVVLSKEDIIACLNYFTAKSIFESCKYLPKEPKALYLTGGGGFNKELVKNIKTLFKNSKICNICAIAPEDKKDLYDPNYLESILFAYLTHRFFMRNVSSFKNTTGVRKQVVLGRMCKANIEQ
jgi:anhydro-N-acetylmuramic acid kinase